MSFLNCELILTLNVLWLVFSIIPGEVSKPWARPLEVDTCRPCAKQHCVNPSLDSLFIALNAERMQTRRGSGRKCLAPRSPLAFF